jgi:hypothetical protein
VLHLSPITNLMICLTAGLFGQLSDCLLFSLRLQGKAWQFKEFPFKGADKGDVRETFTQLFGAYFYYSDEKVRHLVG